MAAATHTALGFHRTPVLAIILVSYLMIVLDSSPSQNRHSSFRHKPSSSEHGDVA